MNATTHAEPALNNTRGRAKRRRVKRAEPARNADARDPRLLLILLVVVVVAVAVAVAAVAVAVAVAVVVVAVVVVVVIISQM